MIIFLQASRSLVEPHSSVSVQFVMALMLSNQRARGMPLFLVPPPIHPIVFLFPFDECILASATFVGAGSATAPLD